MKRFVAVILCCSLFAVIGAFAQQPSNPDPASKEQIAKILEITKAKTQAEAIMNGVRQQTTGMMTEEFKKRAPNAPPEMIAEMAAAMSEMTDSIGSNVSELIDDMVPVYEKYISRQEADAMIAFYSSPEGQSVMQKMPAMATEAMQVSMNKMKTKMDPIMERMNKRMEEIVKKYQPQTSSQAKDTKPQAKKPAGTKTPAGK
jgi:hypothetical protein